MIKQTVLAINPGSSSLKHQLIEPVSDEVLAKGIAERIGTDKGEITHEANGEKHHDVLPLPAHKEAFIRVVEMFKENGPDLDSANVVDCGHRVVQGGWYLRESAVMNQNTHVRIVELCDLAPLHNPAHLIGTDTVMELWPDSSHAAAFGTVFFHDLLTETQTYVLEKETAAKYHIRRYGAHGISHEYVPGPVCDHLGHDDVKQITLHLGSGAPACAGLGRKAIDASVGLAPLEGLVMGTRTGDTDPAVVLHLLHKGMSVDKLDTLFNKKSGMLELCGGNDMRDVWQRCQTGDPDALHALWVYLQHLLKYVGAYTVELGDLGVLTFTAGIGENDPGIRAKLCKKLAFMGVKLDLECNKNRDRAAEVWQISVSDSQVMVLMTPANGEVTIARQVLSLTQGFWYPFYEVPPEIPGVVLKVYPQIPRDLGINSPPF